MAGRSSDRIGESAHMILLSLAGGPKHGYAILQDVRDTLGVQLGPGTLYGALTTLEERGLVAPGAPSGRRRPYEITADGEAVLAGEAARMARVADVTRQRLGWAT